MITIGWKAGTEQYQPDQLIQLAQRAEEAGFQSIDVSDHFHPWSEAGKCGFTWSWLGAVAVQTKSIELGTGVTCPIIRYHPSIIAQAAATVSYMLKNRSFYLGVGTGEALNEYAVTGIWPGYAVRQEMLAEALELIRKLWSGEEITFTGEYYETKKAKLFTLPQKPIPIYISSLVPASAYFAGKQGDGLITVGGQKETVYKEMMRNFSEGAREEGKDPKHMPKLIEINAAFTNEKEKAIAAIKTYWAGTFIPALFDQKIYTPTMSATNGEVVGSDTIEQKMCLSDDPKDHSAYIQQYVDMGFTHVYIHNAGPNQEEFLEKYGRYVLPKFCQV